MMRSFITIVVIYIVFPVNAQTWRWVKDIGTYGQEKPDKMCVDPNYNIYVGGWYMETVVMCNDTLPATQQPISGNGTTNLYITKLDSAGDCIWNKTGISLVTQSNSMVM